MVRKQHGECVVLLCEERTLCSIGRAWVGGGDMGKMMRLTEHDRDVNDEERQIHKVEPTMPC